MISETFEYLAKNDTRIARMSAKKTICLSVSKDITMSEEEVAFVPVQKLATVPLL